MIVTVHPSKIHGTIQAPASKSSMQRACAAASLSVSGSIIKNPGHSNDDIAAMSVIKALGCSVVELQDGSIRIDKDYHDMVNEVNCGESGLGIRMFAPILALSDHEITINGEGSLLQRPMDFFDEIFPELQIKIRSNNGKLPLKIQGPLRPKNIEIDGSLSSQFLTGLLMAYSIQAEEPVTIKVKNLKSRPYIDLTLQVMKEFGMRIPENRNYEEFHFSGLGSARSHLNSSSTPLGTRTYTVEGDWSGSSFLLVAGAIAGEVEVLGIQNTSTQADKKIVDALLDAGAEVNVSDDRVVVRKKKLEAFSFNATDCPDLFPPIVALAAHCNGITSIRGLKRLKHKESDRGITLQEEFEKLGTRIDLNDDEMLVYGNGGVRVKNHTLNSHHDHRIAMACAVTALAADFPVVITNPEAVSKSYPDFFSDLKKLNGNVEILESGFSDAFDDSP